MIEDLIYPIIACLILIFFVLDREKIRNVRGWAAFGFAISVFFSLNIWYIYYCFNLDFFGNCNIIFDWEITIFSLVVGMGLYFIKRKSILTTPSDLINKPKETFYKNDDGGLEIPDSCPYCKSPNTKKIRLCEWCGNQII